MYKYVYLEFMYFVTCWFVIHLVTVFTLEAFLLLRLVCKSEIIFSVFSYFISPSTL